MRGYKTRLFTDLVVDHLKPRNISQGGVIRRKWQMGVRDHALGYHPLFETFKCAARLIDHPRIIGALAWWSGFMMATFAGRPRIIGHELIAHIRHEQKNRLLGLFIRGK
jgi:hypothetical protein